MPGSNGAQVPLTSVIDVDKTLAPLVVNHQGPFPAVTVSYGLRPDMTLDEAHAAIRQAIAELHMPDSIRAEAAGDAKAFAQQANGKSCSSSRRCSRSISCWACSTRAWRTR